ncbi:MAG: peptidase M14 [Robiginitomaculum sp.]|nr:MAG: peptidase M14 [Robiginitomaculum sp.]
MKLIQLGITMLCMCVFSVQAYAKPTHDYFSKEVQFSSDTPLPENYLGFEIGDWHVSPAALTGYMHQLAAQSPRVSIETIGYSHERNALNHVYISSPENIANLDAVLKKHQNAKSGKDDILVINLAYSVHGNEASGANASPLAAYYYAASQEASIIQLLKNTVIIIEPSQNPDGLARFASWANQHKGVTANYDNAHRDHNERWPSGRTNHYWFDLNRDWIFTVHPESKARIKAYQKWRPQVLGDYHEMGGNIPSYFFQPGHPKRTHPNTPKENQRITFELAKFHAEALDARKQPYFTEERFDDFYYGKASAYPDATGSIGVLFEQSSIRGHNRELGGIKSNFSEGIANHLATSLSLVKGSDANRKDILDYTFKYRKGQFQNALVDPVKAYVFADDNDPARAQHFLDMLARHNIPVHAVDSTFMVGQVSFKKGHAWIVKTNGPQYGLVKSLFETRTSFEDEIFYDISSWNIPLAFNLPYAPLKNTFRLGKRVTSPIIPLAPKAWDSENTPVAYAIEWNQFKAPHLLQTLLENDLHPRVSVQSFSSHTLENKIHDFKAGTIIIQPKEDHEHKTMQALLKAYPDVVVYGLSSGLTVKGPDLGSNEMKVIEKIRPALLIGKGVNAVEAGSMRYTVDHRFGIPLTLLDLDRVMSTDLQNYTHILIVDGTYKSWKRIPKKLEIWVKCQRRSKISPRGGVKVYQCSYA